MRTAISILTALLLILSTSINGQNTRYLPKLLRGNPILDSVMAHPETYKVQILYTQINRDSKNKPSFSDYAMGLDKSGYFFPGQAVNLPAAALVLERINNLNDEQLDRERFVHIDTAHPWQTRVTNDPMSESGYASFSNFIQRMFLLHDKDAFNRCYEFLGQKRLNDRVHQLGFPRTWVLHRLGGIDNTTTARHTNPLVFFRNDQVAYYKDFIFSKTWPTTISFTPVHTQEAAFNAEDYYAARSPRFAGKGHHGENGLVMEPFDFTHKNEFPLNDMHEFMKRIVFPNEKKAKLNLGRDDYAFLYKQMGLRPDEMPEKIKKAFVQRKESTNYIFSEDALQSQYPGLRVLSNSGKGYGYMVENAYVLDAKNNVEFVLSAVIYCNSSDILGDEKHYEYKRVGMPFMEELGRLIYESELNRKKRRVANFSSFDVF